MTDGGSFALHVCCKDDKKDDEDVVCGISGCNNAFHLECFESEFVLSGRDAKKMTRNWKCFIHAPEFKKSKRYSASGVGFDGDGFITDGIYANENTINEYSSDDEKKLFLSIDNSKLCLLTDIAKESIVKDWKNSSNSTFLFSDISEQESLDLNSRLNSDSDVEQYSNASQLRRRIKSLGKGKKKKKQGRKKRKKVQKSRSTRYSSNECKMLALAIKRVIARPSKYGIYNNTHGWDSSHTAAVCNIILDVSPTEMRGELSVKRKIDWLMKNESKVMNLNKYLAMAQNAIMKYNNLNIKIPPKSSLEALSSYTNDCLESQMRQMRREMHKMKKNNKNNVSSLQMPEPFMNLVNILKENVTSAASVNETFTEPMNDMFNKNISNVNQNVEQVNDDASVNEYLRFAFDYCLLDDCDDEVYEHLISFNDLNQQKQELVMKLFFHLKKKEVEPLVVGKHLSKTIYYLKK